MVKIAILLPDKETVDMARNIIREQKLGIDDIRAVQAADTVNEAREAVERGAHIIVAYGYQAKLIQEYTNIPMAEIRLRPQDVGLVLKKAKAMVKKDMPHVGLAISKNQLCDMSQMEELFGIRLSVVYLEEAEHTTRGLQKLARLKPDIIIGGAMVCSGAKQKGFPALLLEITEESVAEALQTARNMAYAAEIEKQNAACPETGSYGADGKNIDDSIDMNREGTILARLNGYEAHSTFEDIATKNGRMGESLELAKEYALSDSPVLIYTQEGTEYYQLAEAIHNSSQRSQGPFVSVNAGAVEKGQALEVLFGNQGALAKANHGTVFIKGVEYLPLQAQCQIARLLAARPSARTDAQPVANLNVRMIASSKIHLRSLVQNRAFSEELFYMLHGLVLDIPSLNQRPEDLQAYLELYFTKYTQKYSRDLALTDGARKKAEQLSWTGNLIQLNAFCERLVLTAEKPSVDEVRIQNLYSQLYPCIRQSRGEERVVIYQSPEAVKLNALLEKHGGNRSLVAEEMGISTTTLWRRMKKYGIEARYQLNEHSNIM